MRWRRMRFSLRSLLLAMAVLPAGGYWFALPTLNAQRFAAALEAEDYAAAERLCADPAHVFPGELKERLSFKAWALVERASWRDWLAGERQVKIYYQAHYGSAVMQMTTPIECVATRRGMEFAEGE